MAVSYLHVSEALGFPIKRGYVAGTVPTADQKNIGPHFKFCPRWNGPLCLGDGVVGDLW